MYLDPTALVLSAAAQQHHLHGETTPARLARPVDRRVGRLRHGASALLVRAARTLDPTVDPRPVRVAHPGV